MSQSSNSIDFAMPTTPRPTNGAAHLGEASSDVPQLEAGEVARVLVVDDEATVRRALAKTLMSAGFEVLTAEDGPSALTLLATTKVDVLVVDLVMPNMDGMTVLERAKKQSADVEVMVLTTEPEGDDVVAENAQTDAGLAAVRAGAYDYLNKPLPRAEAVVLAVRKAAERRRLVERTRRLDARLQQHERFGELVGSSSAMQDVYRAAVGVAPTHSTVLITGESGTGKELLARAVHQHSPRADGPFVVVGCGAIPPAVIDVELFGVSADGTQPERTGLLEQADHGTVVLESVEELPMETQSALLRVLTSGELRKVGAGEPKKVDLRVIATCRGDLKAAVTAGRFREDLYYRLHVIPIQLPPLRSRRDDVPLLAYHFMQKHARVVDKDVRRISVEALRALREHPWPGNVRELENALEHAVVMARGDAILPGDLPFRAPAAMGDDGDEGEPREGWVEMGLCDVHYPRAKDRVVEQFDRVYVDRLMKRSGGNVSEAARQAGMDRSNFRRLLKKVRGRSHSTR